MFTVKRFFILSLLGLFTATLSNPAFAGGGGHGGANGAKSAGQPVHPSAAIVSKHTTKVLPNGTVTRDHRGQGPDQVISNTVNGPCYNGCVGEGGLSSNAQPAQNQDHSTGGGGKVNDHRTGH